MKNINQLHFHIVSGLVAVAAWILTWVMGISAFISLGMGMFINSKFPIENDWLVTLIIMGLPTLLAFLVGFLPYLSFSTKLTYSRKEKDILIKRKLLLAVVVWIIGLIISVYIVATNGPT